MRVHKASVSMGDVDDSISIDEQDDDSIEAWVARHLQGTGGLQASS